jgi:hypothetical protein
MQEEPEVVLHRWRRVGIFTTKSHRGEDVVWEQDGAANNNCEKRAGALFQKELLI